MLSNAVAGDPCRLRPTAPPQRRRRPPQRTQRAALIAECNRFWPWPSPHDNAAGRIRAAIRATAHPRGRHNPESLEHAHGKQALRGWATDQGFTARVEAWTADGRRRSDVEVILPGGVRVAIEPQCSEITDAEWLDRHEEYVRAGITDVWFSGSRHMDTQGRVPVRPARLALRPGDAPARA